MGIHQEDPLNIVFGINNERQDCKIVQCVKGGEWMKEMKVREYGWWALYTYAKWNNEKTMPF
jgi:hypothetical protein